MDSKEWRVYQRCLIQYAEPHLSIPGGQPSTWYLLRHGYLMARWTSPMDSVPEGNWYYCIKDEPFDFSQVKSNYRTQIRKGLKEFELKEIQQPSRYIQDIFDVQKEAFSAYPEAYRPDVSLASVEKECAEWETGGYYLEGAWRGEELCGYTVSKLRGKRCVEMLVLKVKPNYEHLLINAAMVYGLCVYWLKDPEQHRYIVQGERTVRHQTNFQNYLHRNFAFRLSYCQLHIKYHPIVKLVVSLLYPLRHSIHRFSSSSPFLYNVYCLLRQEEIHRSRS